MWAPTGPVATTLLRLACVVILLLDGLPRNAHAARDVFIPSIFGRSAATKPIHMETAPQVVRRCRLTAA